MTREEIDKLFEVTNTEVLEAHQNIINLQKNKDLIIKTGISWIDDNISAGLNGKMVFIGSRPSGGKTHNCSKVVANLLNTEINPSNIRVLKNNLEMRTEDLLMRDLSSKLNRSPKDILKREYTEDEKPVVKSVVSAFNNPRILHNSFMLKGEEYRYFITKFISKSVEDFGEDVQCIILTDHIHVYSNKDIIDEILGIQNDIKMSHKNVSFINYFQLNRETEDMWRDTKEKKANPKNMLPSSKNIYQTDKLQQFSDLTVGMVIPQVYDMDEYASLNSKYNSNLEGHYLNTDSDGDYKRLKGRNRIYYNIIKRRMVDDFNDPKVFCDILNPNYEDQANKIMAESKAVNNNKFELPPVFNPNEGAGAITKASWGSINKDEPF